MQAQRHACCNHHECRGVLQSPQTGFLQVRRDLVNLSRAARQQQRFAPASFERGDLAQQHTSHSNTAQTQGMLLHSCTLRSLPQPRLPLIILLSAACFILPSSSHPPHSHPAGEVSWTSRASAALDHLHALQVQFPAQVTPSPPNVSHTLAVRQHLRNSLIRRWLFILSATFRFRLPPNSIPPFRCNTNLPCAAGWGSRFLLYTACLTQAASSGRVYSTSPLTTEQLLSIKYLSCTCTAPCPLFKPNCQLMARCRAGMCSSRRTLVCTCTGAAASNL
jgi:hypothetical protein